MRTYFKALASAGVALAVATTVLAADGKAVFAPEQQEAIARIVRQTLLDHPKILLEAMDRLHAQEDAARMAAMKRAVAENADSLERHPLSPAAGPADADVTVVEFFDYNCPFCRKAAGIADALLADDPAVRVVWKDLPIRGKASRDAALVALAAARQDGYRVLQKALLGSGTAKVDGEKALAMAAELGLDVERLRRDMADPDLAAYLDETAALARTIGIRSTPTFLVGDTVVVGAVPPAHMAAVVAAERRARAAAKADPAGSKARPG